MNVLDLQDGFWPRLGREAKTEQFISILTSHLKPVLKIVGKLDVLTLPDKLRRWSNRHSLIPCNPSVLALPAATSQYRQYAATYPRLSPPQFSLASCSNPSWWTWTWYRPLQTALSTCTPSLVRPQVSLPRRKTGCRRYLWWSHRKTSTWLVHMLRSGRKIHESAVRGKSNQCPKYASSTILLT